MKYGETDSQILLSGKTKNVVKAERSPHSIQASSFSKYYYKTLINKPI